MTGRLPEHLDGRYLRIGPNPIGSPGEGHHWFLGDGMVHGVRFADGDAQWYRNRYVRSGDVARHLGEPSRSEGWESTDFAANTHVLEHAGHTLALVEAWLLALRADRRARHGGADRLRRAPSR